MPKQLHIENVVVGMNIPTLEKNPTTRQLVMYAGASGDFYEIHYDQRFANDSGFPHVVLHGALKSAFIGQLLTNWIGHNGSLKRLSVQYRGIDMPGKPLYCKGVVTRKYEGSGLHLVECDVWIQNATGEKTTLGSAVVALPSKRLKKA